MGCVKSAVCSPSDRGLPKDTGGHTHPPVPPRGATAPPAFLQQSAPPAGGREGGERGQQPHAPCELRALVCSHTYEDGMASIFFFIQCLGLLIQRHVMKSIYDVI